VLFVDECQDCNPVLEAVIAAQDAQVIAVGDASQQLYAWRGATDALERLGGGSKLTLSQSFRFGPAIAAEANKWLSLLNADLRLTGFREIPSRLGTVAQPRAILARSNAGVMKAVIEEIGASRKVAIPSPRPGVTGGGDIERLAKAAISLKQGRGTDHPELMAFQTWAEVQDYAANDPGGEDLAVLVDLIDEHTPEKLLTLTSQLVEERYADVVVSTVHKAKGREWESVEITDFRKPRQRPEDDELPLPPQDKMMLAYVAVTRAKLLLDRGPLAFIDDYLMSGAVA
jgi:superfamily I DNA/RNA helicase